MQFSKHAILHAIFNAAFSCRMLTPSASVFWEQGALFSDDPARFADGFLRAALRFAEMLRTYEYQDRVQKSGALDAFLEAQKGLPKEQADRQDSLFFLKKKNIPLLKTSYSTSSSSKKHYFQHWMVYQYFFFVFFFQEKGGRRELSSFGAEILSGVPEGGCCAAPPARRAVQRRGGQIKGAKSLAEVFVNTFVLHLGHLLPYVGMGGGEGYRYPPPEG